MFLQRFISANSISRLFAPSDRLPPTALIKVLVRKLAVYVVQRGHCDKTERERFFANPSMELAELVFPSHEDSLLHTHLVEDITQV